MITRGGYDWTSRFPWIGEAALRNRVLQFVIDGEAVILGVDGISDFNALHSGQHNDKVKALGEGEEPGAPGDESGDGGICEQQADNHGSGGDRVHHSAATCQAALFIMATADGKRPR